MLISDKQQEANRQNARQSTGPKTSAGKAAVRFNALTWSLRARSLMITGDDPAEYQQLWDDLEAEWKPQTHTQRYYMEQMCTSQWLLTRMACSESRVHDASMNCEARWALLDRISVQRTRLERSFTTAMRELERLQLKRQPRPQPQPSPAAKAAPAPVHQPAEANVPPPTYVMSESEGDQPLFCAAVTPDTR
jgi:hypothetical protein